MKLTTIADLLNEQIRITYYPNQRNRWSASFERGEIGERAVLIGAYGNGPTPEAAIAEYAKQIAGKRIVFAAMTDNRREFVMPEDLQ